MSDDMEIVGVITEKRKSYLINLFMDKIDLDHIIISRRNMLCLKLYVSKDSVHKFVNKEKGRVIIKQFKDPYYKSSLEDKLGPIESYLEKEEK